jgi:hypothetical protein
VRTRTGPRHKILWFKHSQDTKAYLIYSTITARAQLAELPGKLVSSGRKTPRCAHELELH